MALRQVITESFDGQFNLELINFFKDELSLSILEDMRRALRNAITLKKSIHFELGHKVSSVERRQKVYEHFLQESKIPYMLGWNYKGILSLISVDYAELEKQRYLEKEGTPYTYVKKCNGCRISLDSIDK